MFQFSFQTDSSKSILECWCEYSEYWRGAHLVSKISHKTSTGLETCCFWSKLQLSLLSGIQFFVLKETTSIPTLTLQQPKIKSKGIILFRLTDKISWCARVDSYTWTKNDKVIFFFSALLYLFISLQLNPFPASGVLKAYIPSFTKSYISYLNKITKVKFYIQVCPFRKKN